MGNICARFGDGNGDDNAAPNPQPGRYTPLLGPMLGGSFPASVAIYNVVRNSSDIVKLFVFGSVTLGVFAVASGLAATCLGTTQETVRYARFATLTALTLVLSLFIVALCTLFSATEYQIVCGVVGGLLVAALVTVWMHSRW